MLRKFVALLMMSIITASGIIYCSATDVAEVTGIGAVTEANYEWAREGVDYCTSNNILNGDEFGNLNLGDNITRSQMSKMLVEAFDLPENKINGFTDVDGHWAYNYINSISAYMPKKTTVFNPDENVTREEFAATLVRASGLTTGNIRNSRILDVNFTDANMVDEDYKKLLCIAVERAYMKGADGLIRPNDLLTRAEVATFIYRVVANNTGVKTLTWEDLGVNASYTPIFGEAQITVEQAKAWATAKGAHERFIEIAPTYWYYGEVFGIRPEILYAQAGKETGYGKYGGAVLPEMNNWAGIKIKSPIGDRTEDHETFLTPDDGVRAHFNHMSAYVGLAPVGKPHDRYYVVKSIDWAGSIENLEALGGRWCPDLYYGYSILHDCLEEMAKY